MITRINELQSILEDLDHSFEDHCKEPCFGYYRIAGQIFRMEFEDLRMKEYFTWQMRLFVAEPEHGCGRIRIWTDEKAGILAWMKEEEERFPSSVSIAKGEIVFYVIGRGSRIGELVFAWCRDTKEGWVLIQPEQLENFYQLSFMLTPLFSRMAPDLQMSLIHGAGVGVDGNGVILAGLSGAGKSSLAAACLMSGMQYVSDDTMFLDMRDNRAYPMCSTIHVAPKLLDIFPQINGPEFTSRNGRGEKRHLDISALQEQFAEGLPMKALILLKIEEPEKFGIRPIRWEAAAVPLVYSSAHLLGEAQNAPAVRNVLACLRKLPAYEFCMSGNLRYNARYLKEFIKNYI